MSLASAWHFIGALVLCGVIVGTPRSAQAQIVNVLYEAQSLEDGFAGKINAGGDWLNGNSNSVQVEAASGIHYRTGRHLALFMANAAYGEANGVTFVDRQMGHLRYRFTVAGPFQLEAFLQSDRNPFRRRVVRTVFGGGPRWEIFDGPVIRSSVGVDFMPEYERWSTGDYTDSGAVRWRYRISTYLSHSVQITDSTKLAVTVYLQPALNDRGNIRSFADHSLSVDILKDLAVVFTQSLQLDTEPPDTVHPVDSSRKLTVTWTF